MKMSRLSTAIESGQLVLPKGTVHVMRPPVGYDLSALEQVSVETGYFPANDYWASQGLVGSGEGRAATLVVTPRSKTLARAMIMDAMADGAMVLVDGQKTDGVDSLYKDLRKAGQVDGSLAKAHGRLFWFNPDAVDPAWTIDVKSPAGFITRPGVFSESKVDAGSALLVEALPPLTGDVADLGAGWGYLSRQILTSPAVTLVDMIEAERDALDCAVQNTQDARAVPHWADALTFTGGPYDAIVSNPPFHTGRAGDPDLGRGFISTAARLLRPKGTFYMVANRHLPYEATLAERFSQVVELGGDGAFKLFQASRPKR